MRVSTAVEELVVIHNDFEHFGMQGIGPEQCFKAEPRMLSHRLQFRAIQLGGLVKDGDGNLRLSDIVKQSCGRDALAIGVGKSEFDCKSGGSTGDQEAVLVGLIVMGSDGLHPGR